MRKNTGKTIIFALILCFLLPSCAEQEKRKKEPDLEEETYQRSRSEWTKNALVYALDWAYFKEAGLSMNEHRLRMGDLDTDILFLRGGQSEKALFDSLVYWVPRFHEEGIPVFLESLKSMDDALVEQVHSSDIDGLLLSTEVNMERNELGHRLRMLEARKPLYLIATENCPEQHLSYFDACFSRESKNLLEALLSNEEGVEVPFFSSQSGIQTVQILNTEENSRAVQSVLSLTLGGLPILNAEYVSQDLFGFYARLAQAKNKNRALWSGAGESGITILYHKEGRLAFSRRLGPDVCVVLVDLSGHGGMIEFDAKELSGFYEGLFSGEEVEFDGLYSESLTPYGYRVYEIRSD